MAGTRASTRSQTGSAPNTPEKSNTGEKRKASSTSPAAKRGKKQQKTLEETAPDDSEMKEAVDNVEDRNDPGENGHNRDETSVETDAPVNNGEENEKPATAAGTNEAGDDGKQADGGKGSADTTGADTMTPQQNGDGAIEHSTERGEKVPSSMSLNLPITYLCSTSFGHSPWAATCLNCLPYASSVTLRMHQSS